MFTLKDLEELCVALKFLPRARRPRPRRRRARRAPREDCEVAAAVAGNFAHAVALGQCLEESAPAMAPRRPDAELVSVWHGGEGLTGYRRRGAA